MRPPRHWHYWSVCVSCVQGHALSLRTEDGLVKTVQRFFRYCRDLRVVHLISGSRVLSLFTTATNCTRRIIVARRGGYKVSSLRGGRAGVEHTLHT